MHQRIIFTLISVVVFLMVLQCTNKKIQEGIRVVEESEPNDNNSARVFINSIPNSLFLQDSFGELVELQSGRNEVLKGTILIDSKNNIMFPIYHDSLSFKLIADKWVAFHKNSIITNAVSFDNDLKKITPSRFEGIKNYDEFSDEISKNIRDVKLLLDHSLISDTLQIYYQFWTRKFQAELYRNLLFYLKKENKNINSRDISSLKKKLSEFYSNQTFLNVNEYKRGAFYYILLLEKFDKDINPYYRLKNIDTNLKGELKDVMLVHYINNFDSFFPRATSVVKDSLKFAAKKKIISTTYLQFIEKEINLNYENITNNNLFLDDSNRVIEFNNRLSKKINYVDIWASWCMPCLQEMTYSKALKKEYEKQDIEFIYISIDEDYAKWHKSNLKLNLGYYSYFSTFFKEKLSIKSIPRYIILDKSGNIINANAPRPSDPKLKELLDKLLQEQ